MLPIDWKRMRQLLPHLILPALLICYFTLPIAIETFNRPADINQNECLAGSENDPDLIPRPNSGEVRIIRLTNAGEFVRRCDYTDVLYELVWDRLPAEVSPPKKPGAKSLPRFTVMYVHGWKHNAEEDDSDLGNFRTLIRKLADANPGRQVLGIYVAWNARWGLGVLDNLSFWSKKHIADRIAQSAAVTKLVGAIGATRRTTNEVADQFIAIGHSFGARLLFSGTGQIFIYETQKFHPGYPGGEYKVISGPADAVILLNPAFEASLFTAFHSITRAQEQFSSNQAPLVVSIATDADDATRYAFPVGQWIYGMIDSRERTTLGNYEPYFTHTLARTAGSGCTTSSDVGASEQFQAAGLCLRRHAFSSAALMHPHNPFLVARTDRTVMGGHNDIWQPSFSDWLFRFVDSLRVKHEQSDKAK